MKKKHITVIVQSEYSSYKKRMPSVKFLSFPKRFFFFFFIGAVLLVLFGVNGSIHIRDNVAIATKINQLERDVWRLSTVNSKIEEIQKEDRIIRAFLGIEELGSDFDVNKRMGKGGDEPDVFFDDSNLKAASEIADIDSEKPLHERVKYLSESVDELYSILSKMTEKLKSRPTVMPVLSDEIWITSGFGWRESPFTGQRQFHKGIDISGRRGTSIITPANGTVEKVGHNRFIGNYVVVKHDSRFSTLYGHMLKNIAVKKGDKVSRGDVIGYMGTSGMSTGYHLHYEVMDNDKNVNPSHFILNRQAMNYRASID